jgi:hypothetical protein
MMPAMPDRHGVHKNAARNELRRASLTMMMRRIRTKYPAHGAVFANSKPWAQKSPRSIAEAIALCDSIEAAIREWPSAR